MRIPSDLPPRKSHGGIRARRRIRIILGVVVGVLLALALAARAIALVYTDWLWFDEVGLRQVFRGVWGAKVGLALAFWLFGFVLLWVSMWLADRLSSRAVLPGPHDEIALKYRQLTGTRTLLVRTAVAALMALIALPSAASQWDEWLLFRNSSSFGVKDPQFRTDISFFVFRLPFLRFLVGWTFAAIVTALIVTIAAHYLAGGIRLQVPTERRVAAAVKAHVSVLLGLLAATKAVDYWFARYELVYSRRGEVLGASYTDVQATLPALQLLIWVSLAAAVLFLFNIWRRGWNLPLVAVGIWGLSSLVVGVVYPEVVQRFQVAPNETSKERPYIERNIAMTRRAMGLDRIDTKSFAYSADPAVEEVSASAATLRNARLWDPQSDVMGKVLTETQSIRDFYRFVDVDVDRYQIDGEPEQVELATRELNLAAVPQSWENLRLRYTHGYGLVATRTNTATPGGLPEFVLQDLPPEGRLSLDERPQLYYGEGLGGYSIVRTNKKEIDYISDEGTKDTTYDGDGGVDTSGLMRRLAFALRFSDSKLLISDSLTDKSKVMYHRDIAERVRKAAPFLYFDSDPYPVVLEGRVIWVVDAYTATSRYPYAEPFDAASFSRADGLAAAAGSNYVRNSVKVTVDAYNGTMRFYVVDDNDPLVRTYQRIFPNLFTDGAEMPEDLRAHLRYPEELFVAQSQLFGRYHVTNAVDFYQRLDVWERARDAGLGTVSSRTTAQDMGQAVTAPYYLQMALPDSQSQEFVLMQMFSPLNKQTLSAFMVARSDPAHYGELVAYQMPRSLQVVGPSQVDGLIESDDKVSRDISLLSGAGSEVLQGNLQLSPVGNSLLYVQPLYVRGEGGGARFPVLRKVVAVLGEQVASGDRLDDALRELFGSEVFQAAEPDTSGSAGEAGEPAGSAGSATAVPPDTGATPTVPVLPVTPATPNSSVSSGPGTGTSVGSVGSLLDAAAAKFEEAQTALSAGDLGAYQDAMTEVGRLINEARGTETSAAE